ncbi:MAG: hypothetical protein QOI78_8483 [Actinomycetota bacterium]|jgi:hypothetical protein|nr:hypothetical protein [Actinomycetota bacterium]
MSLSTACTVWQVRPVDGSRFRVRYCCRGGPAGTFDVLLSPRLRDVAKLPPVTDADLVLAAAGVLLDTSLPHVPSEAELDTLARTNPDFTGELRRRLAVRDALPQPG